MVNSTRQSSDVVQFQLNQRKQCIEKTPILPFKRVIEFAISHQNRFIIDGVIYNEEMIELSKFEEQDISSGCVLNDSYLLLGYKQYADMALWRWNGIKYEILSRASILNVHKESTLECKVELMKCFYQPKDKSPIIYVALNNAEIWSIKIISRDLQQGDRNRVFQKKLETVIDFELIRHDRLLVLYPTCVLLLDPTHKQKIAQKNLQAIQEHLILHPKFDLETFPLILTVGINNQI